VKWRRLRSSSFNQSAYSSNLADGTGAILTRFVSESSELRYCLPSGHGGVRECGGAATTGSDDGSIPPCADSYKPGLGLAG
jgi:hypothetical protein